MTFNKFRGKQSIVKDASLVKDVYTTIFTFDGEGIVDYIYLKFNNLRNIKMKIILDEETYFEEELNDLVDLLPRGLKPSDVQLIIENSYFIERFDTPISFFTNFKIEIMKTSNSNRQLDMGVIRYGVKS